MDVAEKLLEKIEALANSPGVNSAAIRRLAEAWAWLMVPGQPHGGGQPQK